MTLSRLLFGSPDTELGTIELSRAQLQAADEYTGRENDSAVIVSKTVVPGWLVERERRAAGLSTHMSGQ